MFTALDWVVLALYMIGTVAVGLWASRGGNNFKDYLFGGGQIHWVAVGISIIATSVSATTFLGNPAEVYGADMSFLMFNFGALIAIFVIGFVFIPRFKNAGIVSAYELLEVRFSKPVRKLAAVLYCLHLLLRTGILLYGPSLVLSSILGVSLTTAVMLSAVVATAYTWYGGIKAVIWTDVLQFMVFFGGGIFVLALIAHSVGGFGELFHMASAAGKTTWFHASLDPSNARTLLSAGIAYAVLEIAIRGCDQQFVQRYLSCSGPKDANRSSVLSMVLGVAVSILFYWVGAALFVYYKVAGQGKLPLGSSVDQVFPHFILNDVPPGVTGLIVAAIYAAAMSSLSSAINALANTTESDLLGNDRNAPGNLRRAKIFSLVWAVAGVLAAFVAAGSDGSLLKKALFFTGLFTGPLLGIFLLAFFRPKLNPNAVFSSAFFGMASLAFFNKVPVLPNWIPPYEGVFSWPWNPGIALVVTICFAFVLDLIIPRKKINVTA
jgi:SSS family solute:Na+ symporter